MKEATGELNMTVVVVLLVAGLAVFFFSFLWPTIRNNFKKDTSCDEAICECPSRDSNGKCNYTGATVECYLKDNPSKKFTCTWKG